MTGGTSGKTQHRIRLEVTHSAPFDFSGIRATIFIDGEKKGALLKLSDDFELPELEEVLNEAVRAILNTYRKMMPEKDTAKHTSDA